jgi:dipeptidyl aminopeptidase/acylaminoacyl peptidase
LSNAAYVDPGYLVYVREQTLVAQRFDEKKLQLLGEPRAIAEGVALFPGRTGALFSASRQGVLAYRTDPLPLFQLTWFSRSGAVLSTVGPPGAWDFAPVLSPNERSIAIVKHGMDQDIWLIDAARGATTPFTSEPSWDITPTWSPDGQDIIFSSDRAGPFNLFRQRVGATGTSEMILATSISKFAEDWSADGRYLLYQAIDPETKLDVWALSLKDGVQIPLVHTNFSEYGPKLSRDGRWLAYVSEESGRAEVYVQSFQGAMGRWQISTSGGTQPLWRADGRELTFVSPDGTVNAVVVEPHDSVRRISEPHPLFRSPLRPSVAHHYALAADGQKLLIPVPVEPSATQPISVIINWPAGLSSRNEP